MTPAHALRSTKRASTCSVARARTGTHACERVHACMHSASSPGGLRCVCAAGIIARTRPAGESRKNCSAGRQCVWPCPRAGERHRTHAHNRHEASERARGRETCSTAACKSQWPARVKFAHARAGARARTHCPICRCTAIPGGGEPWSYVQGVRAGESTEKSAQASIRQRSAAFVALFAHAQRFRQPPPGPETAGAPRTDPGLVRRPVASCPRRAAEARRGHARARRQNTPATLLMRGPRRVQRSNGHGGQRMAAGNARHARPRGLDLARPLQRIRTRPAPPRGAPCRDSAPPSRPLSRGCRPMWSVSKRFRPI